MEIKVIDEKSGNPFRYFENEGYVIGFPRSYTDICNVNAVMNGLLEQLGLPNSIHCLEVGAGHNPLPSQSLSQLGARVITLDADWEPQRHTDISYERLITLQKAFVGGSCDTPNRRKKWTSDMLHGRRGFFKRRKKPIER